MHKQKLHQNLPDSEIARLTRVEQELNQRLRQQASLVEIGQYALNSPDLAELMEKTVTIAAQTLEVDLAGVFELLPDQSGYRLAGGIGWDPDILASHPVSAGSGSLFGYTIDSNHTVTVPDLSTEQPFSSPQLLEQHAAASGLSVVIPGKDGPHGVLAVFSRQPRRFSPEDASYLQAVANIFASAAARFNIESELRFSHNQLKTILQGVSNGIIVQDQSGSIVYANEVACRLLNYPTEEALLAVPVDEVVQKFELFDDEGRPFPRRQLPGLQAMEGAPDPSATLMFKDLETGVERWVFVHAAPLYNPNHRVELVVNILQDITELKRSELSRRLMSEAGLQLSTMLNQNVIMDRIASLAVRHLADWCTVHVVDEQFENYQVAVAHKDQSKVQIAIDLQQRYPPEWDSPYGLAKVLRSGKPEFFPDITPDLLREMSRDEENLESLLALGLRSAIIIPLIARGRTIGGLTLVWSESKRQFTRADVVLAEKLAHLSALAIDNARLYQASQSLNATLEAQVNQRTNQLQALVQKLRVEIAERRQAQESLMQSERMLASLFESAPDAALLVDSGGKIIRVNTQAEQAFGYSRSEMVGQQIELLLPHRFREWHQIYRARYQDGPLTRPMGAGVDLYGRRKDSSEFPVDVMLSPVESPDGVQVLCAVRDITERRQMELELSEVQRRLIEHVEAERLTIAQDLHDGPIQDLYGVLFTLKALGQNGQADKVEPVNQLVQQVIDQLRLTCGELRPPALAPFGLEKAIRAHLEQIQDAHPDLDVLADLMPDGQLLPERVRLALYRIYQHAVSNVIRHSGATQLQVSLVVGEQQVELEVSDNGSGFKLPARWVTLAREGHLGLVGTVERAEAVGGRLNIRSSPGAGTSIQVLVPVSGGASALDTSAGRPLSSQPTG